MSPLADSLGVGVIFRGKQWRKALELAPTRKSREAGVYFNVPIF